MSRSLNTRCSFRPSGYQVEVWHDGLHERRVLSDRDIGVVENKLNAPLRRWAEKNEKQLEREERNSRRQAGLAAAETETAEAQVALQACRELAATHTWR